jgi:sensor c-di-GMP phosphodiesterase-like protein
MALHRSLPLGQNRHALQHPAQKQEPGSNTSTNTSTSTAYPAAERWYRQPILWLGAGLFIASLAGCLWLIVMAQRYADPAVPTEDAVFNVPLAPATGTPSSNERQP